ncbi:hypothetical protein ACFQYP_12865 [Nonomuraea antimicrobica]
MRRIEPDETPGSRRRRIPHDIDDDGIDRRVRHGTPLGLDALEDLVHLVRKAEFHPGLIEHLGEPFGLPTGERMGCMENRRSPRTARASSWLVTSQPTCPSGYHKGVIGNVARISRSSAGGSVGDRKTGIVSGSSMDPPVIT